MWKYFLGTVNYTLPIENINQFLEIENQVFQLLLTGLPLSSPLYYLLGEKENLSKRLLVWHKKTRYFFKKSFSLKSHWWVLKNFAKVSNKFIWSTSSLVRLQVCASNFHKKRLRHGCASGNFVKYFESDNNIHMPAFRNVFFHCWKRLFQILTDQYVCFEWRISRNLFLKLNWVLVGHKNLSLLKQIFSRK